MMGQLAGGERMTRVMDDRHILAMGAYIRMLSEAPSDAIDTPSLLVAASESLGGGMQSEVSRETDSTTPVVGNHFTIIEEHAETTAAAIDAWLSQMAQPLASTSTAKG
jgi:hypothetical protein